ncbi:hypothetical protein I3842_12G014100 [Carya illinoinensis]|uniref:DUF4216 domain-containing protein n=1 Tax=Carya illinoinensis TaxID=32201 RepID=A0A922DFJ1_CARIL|nr:hypothetical protein I3842_12G014100 [Carya illinoinensis]
MAQNFALGIMKTGRKLRIVVLADVARGRGFKVDEFGFTLVNFSHLVHTGSRITNDPFVLSSQISQVFSVTDERCPNWVVVVKTKPRDVYDTGEEEVTDDDEDEYLVNEYCINNSNHEAIEHGIDDVVWTRNDIDGVTMSKETEPCTSIPIAPSLEAENVDSCFDIGDHFLIVVDRKRIEMELNNLGQPIKKQDSKFIYFRLMYFN